MALSGGSVTVNPDASYSGSGLALVLFEAEVQALPSWFQSDYPDGYLTALQQLATKVNQQGPGIVAYVTAHAQVTTSITPANAGLQLLPDTLAANQPTKAPTTTKTLGGTIA